VTSDIAKARAFYTALFGWTVQEMEMPGGVYPLFSIGEEGLGGFVEAGDGVPAHWIGYVAVEDVDQVVEKATSLGGTVKHPAADIPEVGRWAVIQDPAGAVVSPFRGNSPAPPETDAMPQTGAFCWDELLAPDTAPEGTFYTGIFGWRQEDQDMGPMGFYHLFKRGDKNAAGMMKNPQPGMPASWMPYVAVADTDAAAARIKELGGQVCVEPQNIPNVGRFSISLDPTGASFGVLGPNVG
jgi:hypothetical protein